MNHSPLLLVLLTESLKVLQNPNYNPENEEFDSIAAMIRNLPFFQKAFGSNLDSFIQLAKWHFNYETHPYGTILLREQDYNEKLMIILDGNICRFQQKMFSEVEKQIKDNEQKQPKVLFTQLEIPQIKAKFQRESRRASTWAVHQLKSSLSHSGLDLLKVDSISKDPHKTPSRKASIMSKLDQSLSEIENQSESTPSLTGVNSNWNLLPNVLSTFGRNENSHERSNFSHIRQSSLRPPETKLNISSDEIDLNNDSKTLTLVKAMVEKYPDIETRCFLKDVLRIQSTRTYGPGELQGENFCRHHQPRENAIIAVSSPDVHLLTISKESYKSILNELSQQANRKTLFFVNIFPNQNENAVVRFSNLFTQKTFQKGEIIYHENDPAETFYFVQTGDIRLSKQGEPLLPSTAGAGLTRNSKKKELPVVNILDNQFFGEEIILNETSRLYTATSNVANTELYLLDLACYKKIKLQFEDFFEILKNLAQERLDWRQGRVSDLFSHHQQQHQNTTPNRSPSQNIFKTLRVSTAHVLTTQTETLIGKQNLLITPSTQQPSAENITTKKVSIILQRPIKSDSVADLVESQEIYKSCFSRTGGLSLHKMDSEEKTVDRLNTRKNSVIGSRKNSIDGSFNKGSIVDFNIRKELLDTPDKIKLPKIMFNNQYMSLPVSPRSSTIPQTDASVVKLHAARLTPTLIRTKKEPSRLNRSQKVSKFSYVKTSQLNNSGNSATLKITKSPSSSALPISKSANTSAVDMEGQAKDEIKDEIVENGSLKKLLQTIKYRKNKNKSKLLEIISPAGDKVPNKSCISIQIAKGKHFKLIG